MDGEKMAQVRDALVYVLDHLNPEDRFNVVTFNTGVRWYAERRDRPRTERNRAQFVGEMRAEGGTNIDGAMQEALVLRLSSDPRPVSDRLTHGLPTEGEGGRRSSPTTPRTRRAISRLFTFGVGDDVNTVLSDTMAA